VSSVVDSDGRSSTEFEAGSSTGRRVHALVPAFAFASVGATLDPETLEVDSGRVEVERDKVPGHIRGAV
jgi:hypothetical protein